jgi:U3 small nucleolar RNA-associated protein 7
MDPLVKKTSTAASYLPQARYERFQESPKLLASKQQQRIPRTFIEKRLEQAVAQSHEAAVRAAEYDFLLHREGRRGFLEPETDLERHTSHQSQESLKQLSSLYAQRGRFRLDFEDYLLTRSSPVLRKLTQSTASNLVPKHRDGYRARYSASSRVLVLAGRRHGHVVVLDWRRKRTMAPELFLNEPLRDVIMLHSDGLFATAQQHHVYIYDAVSGAQIHGLRNHSEPQSLGFLRYHLLLLSISEHGVLRYTDISNGTTVAEIPTNLGTPTAMLTTSPHHGVAFTGHHNGTVQLWSPAMAAEPLAKILAHPGSGGVSAIATDHRGQLLVTAGASSRHFAVWDMRNLFRPIHAYESRNGGHISSMDISQTGLLAIGHSAGGRVTIWKDFGLSDAKAFEPYMQTRVGLGGNGTLVSSVAFAPFEDVLGVGYSSGFESCLVPGAGEPQFDAREPHPYMQKSHRRAAQVQALLEKLPPETITLDPNFIGTVERDHCRVQRERRRQSRLRYEPKPCPDPEAATEHDGKYEAVDNAVPIWRRRANRASMTKTRGRNALANRLRRRQKNVIDEKREMLRARLDQMLRRQQQQRQRQQDANPSASSTNTRSKDAFEKQHVRRIVPKALAAFRRRRRG